MLPRLVHNFGPTPFSNMHAHAEKYGCRSLTLGAHAQRGSWSVSPYTERIISMVCLSVCLCVDDYSRTTGYEAAYERYQQLQCYKGMKNNVAILLKRLRSRDMA